jgi:ADP-ribose pyrophosphatase
VLGISNFVVEGATVIEPDLLRDIDVIAEDRGENKAPFIRVRRLRLRHLYSGDKYSAPYLFDMVEGPFADAVAIVLYHIDDSERIWVGLRRGVRPSVYLRKDNPAKASLDGSPRLTYLELVAGGIEYGDLESIGIDGRAALEVREEAGYEVQPEDMVSLGAGTFLSPGSGTEKLHYRAVRVDPSEGTEAIGDGHPLEEVGDFQFHDLSAAILLCRSGEVADAKTEIGLCRLANYLGYLPELGLWRHELPPELREGMHSLGFDPGDASRDN